MPKVAKIELEPWNGGRRFILSGEGRANRQVDMATDPSGIFDAPVKTIYNSHAFQVGSTYGGKRILQRDVVFGANVFGESKNGRMSWAKADSEWRKAWSYDRPSRLWIKSEGGEVRYLDLQLGEEPRSEPPNGKDPRLIDRGLVIMTCVAPDPWFYAKEKKSSYVTQTDTTGGGYEEGFVWVSNPTDNDVWLVWVCQGSAGVKWSIPDYSFGNDMFNRANEDDSRIISMPALLEGEHIKVDTDPQALNGQVNSTIDTQVYARMNGVQFLYPLPAGTKRTKLPVYAQNAPVGAGIQVRVAQPFSRPWGLR